MTGPQYLQPARVEDALAALAARPWRVLAGGTDIYPAHVERPIREDLLDVSRLPGLRGVSRTDAGWRIGALTTWTDIARAALPRAFHGLQCAAREVGGVQIQNTGTIAGNLCNASPAADGVPPLLALSAKVELASLRGRRTLPLAQFIVGSRVTARAPDELVTAILVPEHAQGARSAFLKLGARRYLVISIVMVAVTLDVTDGNTIQRAGVAVGACSPVSRRIAPLEQRLLSQALGPAIADLVQPGDLDVLAPISDVRGTADFRLDAAMTLLRRAMREAADG